MKQSDSDLLKSLDITKQELSARLHDRPKDQQLWVDTAAHAVLALGSVKGRLQELLGKEAESNRKLSDAEYRQRVVKEFDAVKDGYERRLKDLVQQAAEERLAASKAAAVAYRDIELERDQLRRYEEQLNARDEQLGQRATELETAAKKLSDASESLTVQNRAVDECYERMLELQITAELDRERAREQLTAINAEYQSQQMKTNEIEESCRHYRERLKEAEEIKAQAVNLRRQEADYLKSLSEKVQAYENKLRLVKRREDFVMQRWDETCRQVAHFRLPVELEGLPTP